MGSAFTGIYTATSGLYANQTALNTTSHNISNAETSGYVRQQAMYVDKAYISSVGTGTKIDEIRQIRSIFLDNMYRKEESSLSYWQVRQSTAEDIQAVMNDLDNDGTMQDAIDGFFNAWDELSKDPTSGSTRASLVEYANSFVDKVNQLEDQMDQIQENLDSQVKSMVSDINNISGQIADLNQKIVALEVNGDNANDYRDEANSLLDTLSAYVDISVSLDSSGRYDVSIGGVSLVNGNDTNTLISDTYTSNGSFNTVTWDSGMKLNLNGGMLLGLIESRGDVVSTDGSTSNGSPSETGTTESEVDSDAALSSFDFTGDSENMIPELRKGLNILVNLLTRKVNAIHSTGEGLDGSTGIDFFVKIDDSLPFEAGNIQVNPELDDTNKIAASSIGGSDDGTIASQIYDFSEKDYFQKDGIKMNIDEYYSNLVEWVGTQGDEAETSATNQDTLVQEVTSKKDSLSAVSLDEELSNLVRYQNAYNASARLMNVVDGMIGTLIQSTGVVGR